jgi:hypothetical protein
MTRLNPGVLLEHDEYSIICADLRSYIRGRIAAEKDRVSVWEPLPLLPETRQCPALTIGLSGRGTHRRHHPSHTRRRRWWRR